MTSPAQLPIVVHSELKIMPLVIQNHQLMTYLCHNSTGIQQRKFYTETTDNLLKSWVTGHEDTPRITTYDAMQEVNQQIHRSM